MKTNFTETAKKVARASTFSVAKEKLKNLFEKDLWSACMKGVAVGGGALGVGLATGQPVLASAGLVGMLGSGAVGMFNVEYNTEGSMFRKSPYADEENPLKDNPLFNKELGMKGPGM